VKTMVEEKQKMSQESMTAVIHNFSSSTSGKRRFFNILGWTWAIVFSAVLNAFLFGIMPGMIQKIPEKQDNPETIQAVQVVRMKKPEIPPQKKERPRPVDQEQKPAQAKTRTKLHTPDPQTLKPRLPFELNPKLPGAADSLLMPGLEHFALNVPAFKTQYLADELDAPLTPLVRLSPLYPVRASRNSIQGWVKIQFTVNTSGYVENLKILEAEPAGIFDKSVINCLAQWKFKPGTVDGVAVSTLAQTTINFQLE